MSPRSRYYGEFTPETLVFDANNLQPFSQKIGYITGLKTGEKLSPEESSEQIKTLWKEVK